jgi:hypothetical protein
MTTIYVLFLALALLLAFEFATRQVAQRPEGFEPAPRSSYIALVLIGAVLCSVRVLLATQRVDHNVDEFSFAQTAAYLAHHEESMFSWPWIGHGMQLPYGLSAGLENPLLAPNILSGLSVALTGVLLGALLLRLRGARATPAAILALCFYMIGMLPFEGLTASRESFGNLPIALFMFVRLGWPLTKGRQVLAGFLLGIAAVAKEHFSVLVLAEAALGLLDAYLSANEGSSFDAKAFFKRFVLWETLAALGFFLPLSVFWIGFALHGNLGEHFAFFLGFGTSGGSPYWPWPNNEKHLGVATSSPLVGLFPLIFSSAGCFAVALVLRALSTRPTREHRLEVGLSLVLLVGVLALSVGLRFFPHYYLIPLTALAPLAALRASEALRRLRGAQWAERAVNLGLILLFVVCVGRQALLLQRNWAPAEGFGLHPQTQENLDRAAAVVRARIPEGETILFWGWRPEFYFAAQRTPATRFAGGAFCSPEIALRDAKRNRPALVVFGASVPDVYGLEVHPDLRSWLETEGYRLVGSPQPHGHTFWARKDIAWKE